jgi:predicted amidophosphoribosyltransferase
MWDLSWSPQKIFLHNIETGVDWTYELATPPYCNHCGRSLLRGQFCWDTIRHENLQSSDKVFHLGLYYPRTKLDKQPKTDILTQHILALKDDHSFAQPIGQSMAMTILNTYKEMMDADLFVPVPSYGTNFNHSSALCDVMSKHLQNSLNRRIDVHNCIQKIMDVKLHMAQSGVDSRKELANNMFVANDSISVQGKNIILVDDLLTTGDSKNKCIRILKFHGAKKIWVYVAAGT